MDAPTPLSSSDNDMIKSIFVVDDSLVQCQHAADVCREVFAAATISMAYDGRQALNQLDHLSVDLMLIDLEMPVMDGIELITELSRRQMTASVIIMSSKDPKLISSVGLMAEAGGLKVLGCHQKPITPSVLERAISKLNSNRAGQVKPNPQRASVTGDDILGAIGLQQFSLQYQPKLTVKGIILKGVEALARWQHPELGFISPLNFIAVAEQSNHIVALTLHLFEIALQQKSVWNRYGFNFTLAFNLSPLLLLEDPLIGWIEAALQRYSTQPREIIFEVTETVMLGDVAKSLQTLTRLRLKGFGIALDDYGTGFANAEQLVRLPATELKLDRSLIDGIAQKPQLEKFIASTVSLAADLHLTTVAEGVEQLEDYVLLRKLKVDQVQGYYFSRPVPAETFNSWLASDINTLRNHIRQSCPD